MLDCANGATYRAAPAIFERLGAEVEAIAAEPDGRNINEGCGSTHLEHLAERVAASGAEIGFAFDGDGDRVLAVDGSGRPHDGDELIALAALAWPSRDELNGGVAVTVMSNYGFHQAMEEAGIEVADDQGRRPLRARRAAPPRLDARRRAVRPHHLRPTSPRPATGSPPRCSTMRALGARDLAAAIPMRKLPQTLVNVEVADREALAGATGGLGGGRAGGGGPRGPRPGPACAPRAPSRWSG